MANRTGSTLTTKLHSSSDSSVRDMLDNCLRRSTRSSMKTGNSNNSKVLDDERHFTTRSGNAMASPIHPPPAKTRTLNNNCDTNARPVESVQWHEHDYRTMQRDMSLIDSGGKLNLIYNYNISSTITYQSSTGRIPFITSSINICLLIIV